VKRLYPDLVEEFNIPLDEYPRRCVNQIERWKTQSAEMADNPELTHNRTHEYGSYIMEAIENDSPYRIHGNVLNDGSIENLPEEACVEVACLVDGNGVQPTIHGKLPEQCAALNRTNINVQLMTLEAVQTRSKDAVYQAAMLDPHTGSELDLDSIRSLCDDLFEAHGEGMPQFR
jgi:alpha-galactosidase